jgi:hypothetical protein
MALQGIADVSPHLIELDAQAFTFCTDGAPLLPSPDNRQSNSEEASRGG